MTECYMKAFDNGYVIKAINYDDIKSIKNYLDNEKLKSVYIEIISNSKDVFLLKDIMAVVECYEELGRNAEVIKYLTNVKDVWGDKKEYANKMLELTKK
ncbi:MAG: hypothetical protein RCG15_00840 [Candidatus Rickettsia vulgarisii]